jgi:hypothetical protein
MPEMLWLVLFSWPVQFALGFGIAYGIARYRGLNDSKSIVVGFFTGLTLVILEGVVLLFFLIEGQTV